MLERKPRGTKLNYDKQLNISHIKPSRYIDLVVAAMRSLKDRRGSIPKNIVSYITSNYNIPADRKTISSGVYHALKRGLDNDLILRNSYGHYILAAKYKHGRIPERKRRKKRSGKKRAKRRGKKRRKKKRRKGKKKGRKKRKRGRSRRRKSKKARRHATPKRRMRQKYDKVDEEPRRRVRRRKKDTDET